MYRFTGKPVSQAIRPTGTSNLDSAKRQVDQEALPEALCSYARAGPAISCPRVTLDSLPAQEQKMGVNQLVTWRRMGLRCEETRLSEKRIRIGTVQHSKCI